MYLLIIKAIASKECFRKLPLSTRNAVLRGFLFKSRGLEITLTRLPQERLYDFGEKSERGRSPLSYIRRCLTSFDMTTTTSPRGATATRGLLRSKEDTKWPSSNSTQNIKWGDLSLRSRWLGMRIIFPFAFGEKLERGHSPRSNICHPEMSFWGVSSVNRGRKMTFLELHPKRIFAVLGWDKAEILRYAQDDNQWGRDKSPPPTPPKKTLKEEMPRYARHDN